MVGAASQEMWVPPEAGKGQKRPFPGHPEESPADTFKCGLVRPSEIHLGLDLQNFKIRNVQLF